MSGKCGHASPSKSVQSDGLLSTDSVGGSKSPSPPSADHGVPKRRRTDNPNGVESPPIANSAELLAFKQRLQNYMEKQFTALNVQLRDITLRQAEQEERIARLEQLESRVGTIEKEMAARAKSPLITNPMPASPVNSNALQERFEELQQELDEKRRRLNNIIIMGLKEEETPSSSPERIPSNADKVTGTFTNVVLPDELARTLDENGMTDVLMRDRCPTNTRRTCARALDDFAKKKQLLIDMESCSRKKLAGVLTHFYRFSHLPQA